MFGGYLIYHVVDKIEKLSYCYFDYSVQKKKKNNYCMIGKELYIHLNVMNSKINLHMIKICLCLFLIILECMLTC